MSFSVWYKFLILNILEQIPYVDHYRNYFLFVPIKEMLNKQIESIALKELQTLACLGHPHVCRSLATTDCHLCAFHAHTKLLSTSIAQKRSIWYLGVRNPQKEKLKLSENK